jgi:hypothetical protein
MIFVYERIWYKIRRVRNRGMASEYWVQLRVTFKSKF